MPYTHTYLGPGYKVEREGVTSYTFGIISLEEEYYKTPKSYYENLVVVEDSEGTRGFVMRYAIETDEPIEWEPVFGKNIQSYPCGEVSVVGIYPCICAGHFPGDPSCTCGTKGYVQEFTQGVPCGAVYVTGDGEKGGGFNIGGTPSGTSGGGSTNPSGWYGYPQYIPGNDYTNENFTQEPFTQIPEPKLIDDYTAAQIRFISGILGLSEEAENWLITSGNKANVTALINKLFAKLLSPFYTEESKATFREVINFAIENQFSPEAMELANEVVEAVVSGKLVSAFPFVKYPEGSNYTVQYPNLTNYLKNEFPKLADDSLIVDALEQYGSFSKQQIRDALKWGNNSSTTIEILDSSLMPFGAYGCYRVCGFGVNTIVISSALADALENNTTISENALSFFVGLIIMHEITHMGDFLYNGDMYEGEEGNDFEFTVTGTLMQDPTDAENVYQGYLLKTKED